MLTITIVCFLLLFFSENTEVQAKKKKLAKKQGGLGNIGEGFESCIYEKTLALQLSRWKDAKTFQYYLPKTSCRICYKPPCLDNCTFFSSPSMNVYNNLFEFGLFLFNIPKHNIVRMTINKKCYLKIDITANLPSKEVCISIHECEMSLEQFNECDWEIFGAIEKNVDFQTGCMFFAFAFTEADMVHYAISFDCTYIPSALLNENKSIPIKSQTCYFDPEDANNSVIYTYGINRTHNKEGISVLLPCTTGGYLVSKDTGRFIFGNSCKEIMRNETFQEGFEFVIKKLFSDSEDWYFPVPDTKWVTDEDDPTPTYVRGATWEESVDVKPIKKTVPELENKVRKGCDYVDPKAADFEPPPPVKFPENVDVVLAPVETPPHTPEEKNVDKDEDNQNLKPAAATSASAVDASKGTYHLLSIKMKVVMFFSNLGLIFFQN